MSFLDRILAVKTTALQQAPRVERESSDALALLREVEAARSQYTGPSLREQRLQSLRGDLPKSPLLGAGMIMMPGVGFDGGIDIGDSDVSPAGYGAIGGVVTGGLAWEIAGGSLYALGGGFAAGFALVGGIAYYLSKD